MTFKRKDVIGLVVLFGVALGVRLLLVALRYTDDFANFQSGDYILYRLGAEHFLTQGDFTNSLFLARTPGFPLMVAALGVNTLAVLLANCVLGALLVPLAVLLAAEMGLNRAASLAVGVVMVFEPSMVFYSAFLGSEALAYLLLVGMWFVLARMMRAHARDAVLLGVVAGLLLAGSAYARPASYLLWTGLGLWLLWRKRQQWAAIGAFMLVSALGVGAWMVHNGQVFGHYTFSTVGNYTMLYYHAASVEHLASGDEMDVVYTRINQRMETLLGRDPSEADPGYMHRYLAATPDIDAALSQVAREIMLAHPLYTALTFPVGFVRMFGLLPGRVAIFRGQLPLGLVEVVWNGLLLAGTATGLWVVFRRKEWDTFWWALLNGAYFTAGVLLVKSVGDVRERTAILPIMVILSVIAAQQLWNGYQARRAAPPRSLTES